MKHNVSELIAPMFETMGYQHPHSPLKSVHTGVMHDANPACVPQGTKLKETEYCSLICWIFLCLLIVPLSPVDSFSICLFVAFHLFSFLAVYCLSVRCMIKSHYIGNHMGKVIH